MLRLRTAVVSALAAITMAVSTAVPSAAAPAAPPSTTTSGGTTVTGTTETSTSETMKARTSAPTTSTPPPGPDQGLPPDPTTEAAESGTTTTTAPSRPSALLAGCSEQQFWDVAVTDQFCPQVTWLASTGVTTGYTDPGQAKPGFHPTASVSRQAMAAFLYRYGFNGQADPACAGSFRLFGDVPAGGFCGSIEWLAGAGISGGYADGGFHPTAAVSRQAMAAFLYRFAHPGQTAPACTAQQFWDVPVGDPFCPQISWLASTGITTGYTDSGHSQPGFHPASAVSRQAMAAFLYRADDQDVIALNGATPLPAVTGIDPESGPTAGGTTVTITGTGLTGATQALFDLPGAASPAAGTNLVVVSATKVTVTAPAHAAGRLPVRVTTAAGTSVPATATYTYTGASAAPTITSISPATGPVTGGTTVTLTGTNLTGATGVRFGSTPGTALSVTSPTSLTVKSPAGSTGAVDVSVTTPDGTATTTAGHGFTYTAIGLPPDPATVAGPLDPSTPTDLQSATSFLYSGDNPIQVGVAAGTITQQRAAVLRGHVLARGGQPLSGVTVSVAGHPEFGHTTTRTDGGYDLAVNGGGRLILDFAKQGYAGAQREVSTAWQNYRTVDDVTLIAYDSAVTAVDLAGSETGPQVAQGSPVTDDSGTRQATLLFQPGTTATATRPDGSTLTLSTAHVRATEFTVGQDGPSAMPGILPQLSAYTYAAEFSVDEAVAAGAQTVTFSKPVINYTENFLHFSVGTPVPTGYYDRDKHSWVAAANGRVIKVLAVTGGVATLDMAGKGKAATPAELSALGITDAELTTIGGLYAAGTSLWRVPIDHFTPWDHNWPFAPPPGATAPKLPELSVDSTDSCQGDVSGSVIGCQNQTLGERLPVAGTSLTLAYQNERTPGRDNSTVRIPLTGDTVPAGATAVVFKTDVAGQRYSARMQIKPNLSTTAHWDGKDAYGRTVQGSALMEISVGFVYPGSYAVADGSGSSFGSYGAAAIDGDRAREEVTLWATTQQVPVGGWDARGVGLGGWTLSAQHFYDPVSRQLYLGDGSQTGGGELLRTMKPVAGNGTLGSTGDGGDATAARLNYPTSVAVAADGTMYIADTANSRVRRVNPDGTIDTIAGNGNLADTGDGGPATAAGLRPTAIAIAPDGSLVVGTANHRVRQFTPGGTIKTIAGTGAQGWSGNGGPATAATFGTIASLKYSPNGTLYVVDGASCQIRTIDAAGVLRRVAGIQPLPDSNNPGCGTGSTDGGKADKTFLASPSDVAFLPDGSMLIADTGNSRVRRMAPDGIITTVLPVDAPTALAVLPSGGWLVTDTWTRNQLKWVDTNGTVRVLAGTGLPGNTGDGGPAAKAAINKATSLAVAPDGRIVFTDSANNRVRAITVPNTGQTDDQLAVVSADGGQIFHFDHGRQVSTIDARTGVTVRTLRYDGAGRLTGLTDVDGNVTTIERDGSGKPTGIRAPGGQLTTLELDAHGYLSAVTAPGSKPTTLTSDPNGLLRTLTEPGGGQHAFDYDNRGLLLKDRSPDGRSTTLAGSSTATSHTVTLTTSLGQVSTMTVETLGDGSVRRTTVAPSGAKTVATVGTDGTGVITEPDGSVLTSVVGPDPRFGMAAPILASQTLRTPAGLVTTRTTTLTADLSDPANAMSLTRLTRKVTTNGRTTTTVLDNTAHTIVVTTPEGRSRTTTTDEHGKVIGYDLGAGIAPVTLSYDDTGAPLTMAQGGQSVTYSYDSRHRVATMTDRAHRVTTFGYDGADRLTSVTAPGTGVTKYAYDDNGRVTEITQPGGRVHRFTYDDGGRVATDTPAGAGTVSNTYDTDGALTQRATPGRTTELDQDAKGRLSSATDADGTVTFGYDPATGRLTGTGVDAGDPATTAARAFTFDGPLLTGTSVTGPAAAAFAYTYNADLMPTRTVLTAGTDTVTVDRSYDKDLALTGVGGYTITRGSGGAASGMGDGTAAWTYHYDQFGRVDRQVLTVAGHAISTLELTWGADGSLAARTDPANPGTQLTYGYDADGHLTTVKRGGTVIESYGYDADGRRITRTLGATPAQSFGYDDADRLTSTGGVNRQYSPDGSLTVRGSDTFGYGVGGMLTGATVGGTTVSYTYDAEGRRTTRTTGGQTTSYYYGSITSANRVSAIRGGDGVLTSLLYDEFGHLASYDRAGQRFYVVTDQVGSPVAVTDAAGTVIKKVAYDSFGNVVSDSAPAVLLPLGFAGGLADPVTGLVRFGQRDYEPATGRWTTRDPAGLAAGQLDVYAYVADDPASRSDLSGLGDDEEPGEEQEYASLDLWQYNKDRFAKLYDTAVDKVKGFVASKLCLGPVCVNPEHPEMSVGKDVTVNAGGDDVLTVGAKCTVGVTENPNLHEDNFSWKLKLAAAIPALKKIPLVGKYLGIDETYGGGFGSVDNYFGLDRSTIRAAEIGGVRVPGIEDQQQYGGGN